ncbi:hypothetical protein ACP86_00140 [Marinobacter sp. CP1]|jgi:hypothetical protein|nr:hypothetical protein ACP86_00140 [Marinobacter sp. CP1]
MDKALLNDWAEMFGAFGKAQSQKTTTKGVHQAEASGFPGFFAGYFIGKNVVRDFLQDFVLVGTFVEIECW